LERLLTTPLAKLDLLLGYGIAFALAAAVQASVAAVVAFWFLDLQSQGSAGIAILLAVGNAVLGMAMGLFVSAFARSEFQAVQFMPAVVLPQLLLCGLIARREEMTGVLQAFARAMPMTYSVEALGEVARHSDVTTTLVRDAIVIVAAAVAFLVLAAATLRRRTP
jgi:ABC-2 type transport system permease protein